jgi:EAL domain-containing protein (putative c-di-GMP-specific phosphodiesterase class I)
MFYYETSNIPIIAEGIETALEFEKLIEMGVEYGQGFYFARPARVWKTY